MSGFLSCSTGKRRVGVDPLLLGRDLSSAVPRPMTEHYCCDVDLLRRRHATPQYRHVTYDDALLL